MTFIVLSLLIGLVSGLPADGRVVYWIFQRASLPRRWTGTFRRYQYWLSQPLYSLRRAHGTNEAQ